MADFITGIVDFLALIGNIVGSFLAGLVQLVTIIPQALQMLTYSIASLPPVFTVYAIAFVSVSVVYLVINR